MKKILMILSLFLIIFVTGCNKDNNIDNNDKNTENNGSQNIVTHKFQKKEWKCFVPLDNVSYINSFGDLFITKEGELYQFSLEQLYSNNEYCKKVDTDKKFVRIINSALITDNNKIFAYDGKKFDERVHGWTGAFDYEMFDKYKEVILFSRNYGSTFDINFSYAVVQGKAVNIIDREYNEKTDSYSITSNNIGYLLEDEEFVGGYYQVLKTTKNYYTYSIINGNECNKYADIECQFGLKRVKDISANYESILYFDGIRIIYKDDLKHIYFYENIG